MEYAIYEGDLNIEGDLEIRATGTASLMQKEVRSQRLTMFLQTVQNPAIAPFVKISEIIKELAYSLDLDPDEVINDPAAAEIYAKIIGLQNAQQQGQEQPTGPVSSPQWVVLKEYLQKLQELTVKELAMAQSEQAMFRSQGKWSLLEQLIHLQDNLKNN